MKGDNKEFNHDRYSNKRELSAMYRFSPSTDRTDRKDGGAQDFGTSTTGEDDLPTDGGFDENGSEDFVGWLCDAVKDKLKQVTKFIREETEKEMAIQKPQVNHSTKTNQGGAQPGRRNDRTGFPNLRVADVTYDQLPTTIIDAQEPPKDDQYGNAIILKIEYRRKTFLWNLKGNNPCFDVLYNSVKDGSDPASYKGLEYLMYKEADQFSGVEYIRVKVDKKRK